LADARALAVGERKREVRWAAVTGRLGWECWAGCQAFKESGPTAAKDFTNCLEVSFEIEFEFESLSNSNFTQIKFK
jgi:hypothetical protein